MEVRYNLDWGEMRPGWRWYANMVNLMKFRCNLDGGEMGIYGPGWRWDGTWMEWGLYLCGCELHISKPWCVRDGVAWIWYSIFETLMEMRCHMDWCDLQIYAHLLTWDIIWTEMTCAYGSLDWSETIISRLGWRWNGNWIDFDMNILRYA